MKLRETHTNEVRKARHSELKTALNSQQPSYLSVPSVRTIGMTYQIWLNIYIPYAAVSLHFVF